MFTGIIEGLGRVEEREMEGSNVNFWFSSPFTQELRIDQSVAHNGVCLTVVEIDGNKYKVCAINETLDKSMLGALKRGDEVNLERCLAANGRFDGHIVQGHVDQTATVKDIQNVDGSWKFTFRFAHPEHALLVPKGSITINGVSLTVVDVGSDTCTVAIIPYTFDHTNFKSMRIGDEVNIEFDILGKYVMEAERRLRS